MMDNEYAPNKLNLSPLQPLGRQREDPRGVDGPCRATLENLEANRQNSNNNNSVISVYVVLDAAVIVHWEIITS